MTSQRLLQSVAEALASAGIAYMVTGSFASSLHGRPRATQDLDLVIAPTPDQLRRFVRAFSSPQYYVNEGAALEALVNEDQFNVIESATGWKVDCIIKKSRSFSETEFARRLPAELNGIQVFVASAEDVLLAKLEWAKRGHSERQVEDAAGILQVRGSDLDEAYLRRWVTELGLEVQWAAAMRRADPGPKS